jgi:hypothetical protein
VPFPEIEMTVIDELLLREVFPISSVIPVTFKLLVTATFVDVIATLAPVTTTLAVNEARFPAKTELDVVPFPATVMTATEELLFRTVLPVKADMPTTFRLLVMATFVDVIETFAPEATTFEESTVLLPAKIAFDVVPLPEIVNTVTDELLFKEELPVNATMPVTLRLLVTATFVDVIETLAPEAIMFDENTASLPANTTLDVVPFPATVSTEIDELLFRTELPVNAEIPVTLRLLVIATFVEVMETFAPVTITFAENTASLPEKTAFDVVPFPVTVRTVIDELLFKEELPVSAEMPVIFKLLVIATFVDVTETLAPVIIKLEEATTLPPTRLKTSASKYVLTLLL